MELAIANFHCLNGLIKILQRLISLQNIYCIKGCKDKVQKFVWALYLRDSAAVSGRCGMVEAGFRFRDSGCKLEATDNQLIASPE
jgi:hypothetical protein